MLFRRAGVEAYNPFDMAYAHQVSARLAPVLATSGLSVQKIVRYICSMSAGAARHLSATLPAAPSKRPALLVRTETIGENTHCLKKHTPLAANRDTS